MTLTLTKSERRWGLPYFALQMLVIPFLVANICVLMGITSGTAMNLICFYINAALAAWIFRELLAASFRNAARSWKDTLLTAVEGFCLYWVLNVAATVLILLMEPEFGNVNDAQVGAMLKESPLLMTVAVIFAAPLAEECLFRGWLFTGLSKRSLPRAYAVTCAVFSAIHVVGYIGLYDARTLALCFVQYLAPSFALCWACRKNDSLCAPLLMHMLINTIACLLTR